MILNVSNIAKAFDGKDVLKNVSFHIEEHEKAALIGVNGAGKSTLLKIIMKEIDPDSGQVVLEKNRSIGYLAQHQDLTGTLSIYDQLLNVRADILKIEADMARSEREMTRLKGEELEAEMKKYAALTERFQRENGYAYKSEVVGVLKGLGFSEEDFGKRVGELSGGQKTRVALGKLLLTDPDLILLDEPTNHLDMHSVEWLETYLLNYRGAVLIVSHDRYFLNRVVTKVIEIERGTSRTYSGNYDAFSGKKEQLRRAAYAAWQNAERERRHQEEVITKLKQFNREKSIKRAESREKMLARMEMPDKPEELDTRMKLVLTPGTESGNDVLTVDGLSKSFDGQTLFSSLHFEIKKGEHVVLIGDNGTGKSTLLKILNGHLAPDSGDVVYGANVEVGYYDQEMQVLDSGKTIFDEISDDYPEMTNTRIRSALAAFLFTDDDVFKLIGDLSGGERARVSLCKLMLSNCNFLMLDEPTNHLDIDSREILESAIRAYTGTVLCVSHDRYFINRTATRILDLTHQRLLNYIGNYDYYLEKKDDIERASLGAAETDRSKVRGETQAKRDWVAQKEAEAKRRKRENDLKKAEARIAELENENNKIDAQFENPDTASDPAALTELSEKKAAIEKELEETYALWETLEEAGEKQEQV